MNFNIIRVGVLAVLMTSGCTLPHPSRGGNFRDKETLEKRVYLLEKDLRLLEKEIGSLEEEIRLLQGRKQRLKTLLDATEQQAQKPVSQAVMPPTATSIAKKKTDKAKSQSGINATRPKERSGEIDASLSSKMSALQKAALEDHLASEKLKMEAENVAARIKSIKQ